MCPHSKDQRQPELHCKQSCQRVEGGEPSPLLSPDKTHLESHVLLWVLQDKCPGLRENQFDLVLMDILNDQS